MPRKKFPHAATHYEDGSIGLPDGRTIDAETGQVRERITTHKSPAPARRRAMKRSGVKKHGGTF